VRSANRATPPRKGAIRTWNPTSSHIGGRGLGWSSSGGRRWGWSRGQWRATAGAPPRRAAVYCRRWRWRGCIEVRVCRLSWGRRRQPSPEYSGRSVGGSRPGIGRLDRGCPRAASRGGGAELLTWRWRTRRGGGGGGGDRSSRRELDEGAAVTRSG
jgi:hypothetical protein